MAAPFPKNKGGKPPKNMPQDKGKSMPEKGMKSMPCHTSKGGKKK